MRLSGGPSETPGPIFGGESWPLFGVAPPSILYLRCRVWSCQFSLWRPGGGRKDGGKTVKATVHAFLWLEFDFGVGLHLTVTWSGMGLLAGEW